MPQEISSESPELLEVLAALGSWPQRMQRPVPYVPSRLKGILRSLVQAEPQHKDLYFIMYSENAAGRLFYRLRIIARCYKQNNNPIYYVGDEKSFDGLLRAKKIDKVMHEEAVAALRAVESIEADPSLIEIVRHVVESGRIYSEDSLLGMAGDPYAGFSEAAAMQSQPVKDGPLKRMTFLLHPNQYGHDFLLPGEHRRKLRNWQAALGIGS